MTTNLRQLFLQLCAYVKPANLPYACILHMTFSSQSSLLLWEARLERRQAELVVDRRCLKFNVAHNQALNIAVAITRASRLRQFISQRQHKVNGGATFKIASLFHARNYFEQVKSGPTIPPQW
jgi:hypothetical protein